MKLRTLSSPDRATVKAHAANLEQCVDSLKDRVAASEKLTADLEQITEEVAGLRRRAATDRAAAAGLSAAQTQQQMLVPEGARVENQVRQAALETRRAILGAQELVQRLCAPLHQQLQEKLFDALAPFFADPRMNQAVTLFGSTQAAGALRQFVQRGSNPNPDNLQALFDTAGALRVTLEDILHDRDVFTYPPNRQTA